MTSPTAVVITEPRNGLLSSSGVGCGLAGDSVTENDTLTHIHALMEAADDRDGHTIVGSPHKVYDPETENLTLRLRKRSRLPCQRRCLDRQRGRSVEPRLSRP